MSISRTEAAASLSEIERTTGRSRELTGYRVGGPILMLWGLIWAVAYVGMGVLPTRLWGWVWLPLDILGVLATVLIAGRASGKPSGADRQAAGWRVLGAMLALGAFSAAICLIFRADTPAPYLALPGLECGVIYGVIGVLRMTRYAWIGAAMFAATLVGFFMFPAWLPFWMAATGGGGLMLGGLWLWRA